jgi:DNA-binding MarR family transcriptional regulator
MDKKSIAGNLVTVRMKLENICDGFDAVCSSKKSLLTTRIKMLHLLSREGKLSPSIIISKIGVAKSNLAILAKGMIKDDLIEKIEDEFDRRVIYYNVTKAGKQLLDDSLKTINAQVCSCSLTNDKCKKLNKKLEEIIKILG